MTKTFKVEGMMCSHCPQRLTKVLMGIQGISQAEASFENKSCTVTFEGISVEAVKSVIEDAGFDVISII